MIINTKNIDDARKQVQKIKKQNPSEKIIVKAQDEEFNKKVLEMKNINMLLSPEFHDRKDKLKQKDSGLNEYLCRLAKNNNTTIAIDIENIQKLDKKEKAIVISRIIQNIDLCKKEKTKMTLYPIDKYPKQDIMGFFIALKSSTYQAKQACS
ncbi:MAG: hypothetical protein Q8N99_06015 [Nanoarchaeota archaeon]|nr:hypothetical protein [Nanoarchaeota archaeon]